MTAKRWLSISLILVLVGAGLAAWIQQDKGNVQVNDVRFAGKDGKMLSGLLYIPKDVNNENQAPGVLTMHGYINSRETQSGFAIEFARRGYVVLSMDMSGHGYSEQIVGDLSRGAYDGLQYLRNLPFVDENNIAVEGHSMGGWSVLTAAGKGIDQVKTVILVGSSPETYGSPKVLADTPFNFGVIYSRYDEFARLMWGIEQASDIVQTDKLMSAFGSSQPVIPEKVYGDFTTNTARKLYIPNTTHPGQHLSKVAIANAIEFLQDSVTAPNPLDPKNQIWHWKEFGTLVALIGLIIFLFAFPGTLLKSNSCFSRLTQPLPNSRALKGPGWAVGALIATALPALTFFKFQAWGNSWLPPSAWWPQNLTSGFMIWALLNGLIALVLFLAWHFQTKPLYRGDCVTYGLSTNTRRSEFSLSYLGRSLILALTTVWAAHILVSLVQWAFLVDFRWWVVGIKPMSFHHFSIFLKYLIPFFAFFLINGIVLHGQLRTRAMDSSGDTLVKSMFISIGINIIGLAVLVILQVGKLKLTETLFFPTQSLGGIIAYQFLALLSITGALSTYLYRKTGNVYLGAFINAIFVTDRKSVV